MLLIHSVKRENHIHLIGKCWNNPLVRDQTFSSAQACELQLRFPIFRSFVKRRQQTRLQPYPITFCKQLQSEVSVGKH